MELSFYGLAGFPMVEPGDDLAQFIIDAIKDNKKELLDELIRSEALRKEPPWSFKELTAIVAEYLVAVPAGKQAY